MIGTIYVEGLEIECIIGIHPEERENPQLILVDAELDRDFAPAASSENVDDTVDYVDLAAALTEMAVERQYQLLETYAEEAAGMMLDRFGGQRSAVKVMKPAAVPLASWAAVKVERRR